MFKSLKLYKDQSVDPERILSSLVDFGYKRQESVSAEGDFSRRGGIIDIFPFSFELPIRIELDNDLLTYIKAFNPQNGQPLWEHNMVIVLPVKKAGVSRTVAFTEEFPLSNFVDLKAGDYVVHNQYGIGRFLGLEKIRIQGKSRDHLVIEYDRQEKLYVPVDNMHLVQKYIAFQARRPKLFRLGSKEWQGIKERTRKGIQKMAWELLALQAARLSSQGFKYSLDTEWQKEFEKTFPYTETPDQAKAMEEVRLDMESGKPMDRLLCGDVGYGKTEVAMRAAFKAVMDNKQVAYLVPTTILAEQHFTNFSLRLKDYPVNVHLSF
ncbi:MAG: DEAD/DEAH box helicase [Candidatus Omnitrophica bacterium]|nr:DEAD/DEAH box helicase [Candidatus Omnitrophota bacterium]